MGKLRVSQSNPAQRTEQHIGHGCEPQAELVGAHGSRRGPIGEQIELTFLDAVLHLAASAIDLLIEVLAADLGGAQRGDDKPWIGVATSNLGLADDETIAAPTVQRRPHKVFEATRRLAGADALHRRGYQLGLDRLLQTLVARQTEQEVDTVCLTPCHQCLAGKAGVTTQQNAYPWPAPADLRDNARNFLDRPGGAVDVRTTQLGRQQMPAAEDVERQVAVAIPRVRLRRPADRLHSRGRTCLLAARAADRPWHPDR